MCVCGQCRACCGQCRARSVRAAVRSASDGRRRAAPSSRRLFHTAKFLDTALRNAGEERDCDGRQASALATAAGRRRQRRAHEKNQRKRVMSGVEGALSTRTPRPRWPPRKRVMSGVEGALSTRTPRPRWPPPQGGRTSPPPQGGHRPPP